MSAETIGSAADPNENRLPEGFEPWACRFTRSTASCTEGASCTDGTGHRLKAPTELGLFGASFREPFHLPQVRRRSNLLGG